MPRNKFAGLRPRLARVYLVAASLLAGGVGFAGAQTLSSAPYSGVTTGGLTANWTSSFSTGTLYFSQLSTAAFPNAFSGNQSSNTFNTFASFSALSGGTTYFAQVSTASMGPFTDLGSVMTPAAPVITAAPFTGVAPTGLTANWTSTFSTSTLYYTQLSTGAFPNSFSGNQSSNTFNTSAGFSGLTGGTVYFAQVATAPAGPFTNLGAAVTQSTITPAAFSGVTYFGLTANWTSSFPGGTLYYTQLSTGVFPNSFSGNLSSNTLNLAASYAGLSGATTYFAEISTAPGGPFTSLGSVVTPPAPAITAGAYSAITIVSLTANWTSTFGGGTTYYAQLSSGAFPNSFSGNQSLSTLGLSAAFAGLTGATTYYVQVSTFATGPFTSLGSAVTLPPPLITALPFSLVSANSLQANWGSTFSSATIYYSSLSTGALPNAFAGNQTVITSSLFASYIGLSPSTTYYAQVSTAAAGPFTTLGSTVTSPPLPPIPGQPGLAATVVLGVSSISWTWSAASNATSYKVYDATGAAILLGTSTAASFVENGLAPNTPHRVVSAGYNAAGGGPLSPAPATAYTLANPPSGTAASAITSTSAFITWGLNLNPPGTSAEVQRSTDGLAFAATFSAAATQYPAGGMLGCTTYYFRVRDQGFGGSYSAFDSTISLITGNTVPAPPGSLTASGLAGNQVALSWTASPTEGVTQYGVYYDAGTGTVNYAAPLAVLAAPQTTFTTGVLASSASYTFAVRSTHRCGATETAGVFAIAAATGTLPSVRAVVSSPDSGKRVAGNSVTLMAAIVSGSPDQVEQISFQYRVPGSTAWTNVPAADLNHPNPDEDFPFFIHWDVTGAAPGSYDLRAVAVSVSGSSDTAPGAITVVVDPITPDIIENLVGATIQKAQLLNNATLNSISAGGEGASDPMASIVLPAGALSASTVTLTVVSNPAITTGPPSGMAFVGSAMQVDLNNGQHALSGGALSAITLSYPDTAKFPSTFQLYSLDPATGVWSRDFASTVNLASHTVTGLTPHFSIFAIIAGNPAAPDLGSVRVYPNPYKPNGANADEGKPFGAGDPTSGIVFDRLPGIVTITIYTASGRMVAKFDSSNGAGAVHWDGKNQDGRDAASGGYFAVISAPGLKSVVRKLAIIR
ncbi:MAG: hypothetical protein HY077_15255 [Elusimicrobia bacterium]|nr:hypothetical protein [Elusimicrobiota bacterium]